MEENKIVKYESGIIKRISNQIGVTNKLLALSEPLLIPYRKGDKWGFCTADKKILIDCVYDEVTLFSEGLAAVKFYGNKSFTVYIDKSGKDVFETPYQQSKGFKNGISIVSCNNKYGVINKLGKEVFPCIYDYIPDFIKNRAVVKLNNKYGVIDKSGKTVIESVYDNIYFQENMFICYLDGKCGIFDLEGNILLDFHFDWISNYFYEGFARIYKNNKYGFIDRNGKLVIDCLYKSIEIMGNLEDEDFENGFALVRTVETHGKNGYIDYSGKWFEDKPNEFSEGLTKIYSSLRDFYGEKANVEKRFKYDRAGGLEEGYAWVQLNGKRGFVNKDGDLVISCIYEGAYSFRENLAWVKLNGEWGVIDKAGNVVIDFSYQDYLGLSDGFKNGVCIVAFNNKFGVIDKSGNLIIDCIYDMIGLKSSGFFEAEIKTKNWKLDPTGDYIKNWQNDIQNVRRSLFNISGKLIIDNYFGYIGNFEDGLIKLLMGYIDKNGNKYWED